MSDERFSEMVKAAARMFVAGAAPSHLEAPLRRMREDELAKQYEPRIRAALEEAGVKELLAVVEAARDLNEYLDGIAEDARTPGEKKLSAILAAKLDALDAKGTP